MPPLPFALSFKDLFVSLTGEIRDQQARLDRDSLQRLTAFLFLLKKAKELGYETLARELAPASLAMNDTEVEIRFRFAHSFETQSALNIQPLNLGFMRRYAYSEFAQSSLQWRVERIPFSPKPVLKDEPSA